FMLTPDDAQSEGAMRGVVVHHGINKIAFELAGLFVGDSIWHNDGNVIVFMLIGPWQRYDLCSRRRYLLHECQKRLWYGLHREIPTLRSISGGQPSQTLSAYFGICAMVTGCVPSARSCSTLAQSAA